MAKTLLKNGTVLTLEEGSLPLVEHDILIQGGCIVDIAAKIPTDDVDEVLDATGMIVMPGLINAHIHTWQTSLRGLSTNWTGINYFRAMHAGLANFFSPEDIRIANLVGAINQLNNGVTTVVDWHHNNPTPDHTDAAIGGLEESGARAVFIHGSAKPDPKDGQVHFSKIPMNRAEVERIRNGRLSSDDALVTMGLGILGPQWGVEEAALQDFRLGQELDLVTSMHHSGRNMPAPEGYARAAEQGLLGPHINIVHGNRLTDRDFDILADHGASFSVTAEVEMQLGYGELLIGRLVDRGLPVSLGTDIESAFGSDMLAAARIALQAERHMSSVRHVAETGTPPHPTPVTARQGLAWATSGGAQAMQMGDRIGTLARGKQADIICIRATDINLACAFDPYNVVVGYAHAGNIDTVMVAGRVIKQHGQLLRNDLPDLLAQMSDSGRRIFEEFKAKSATAVYA